MDATKKTYEEPHLEVKGTIRGLTAGDDGSLFDAGPTTDMIS